MLQTVAAFLYYCLNKTKDVVNVQSRLQTRVDRMSDLMGHVVKKVNTVLEKLDSMDFNKRASSARSVASARSIRSARGNAKFRVFVNHENMFANNLGFYCSNSSLFFFFKFLFKNIIQKIVDLSGVRTQIIRVDGKHAVHYSTTTAQT